MRSVFAMAMKDLRLISRDGLGLFFIFGFPVLMGVFFGSMYNWVGSSSSPGVTIAAVDEDQTDGSRRFLEKLGESGDVNLEELPREEAIDRVRRGQLAGLIAVPPGYGEASERFWEEGPAIQLGVDPSRKSEAAMLEGFVMRAAGELMMDRFQDPGAFRPMINDALEQLGSAEDDTPEALRPLVGELMGSLDEFLGSWEVLNEAEAESDDSGDAEESGSNGGFQLARVENIDVTYTPPEGSTEALVSKMRSKWDISFPQGMLWGVLACAATFAVTIVRERKQGTMLRLQAAPVTRWQVLAGKALACFLTVLGVLGALTGLGILLGMRPGSPLLLVVAAACVAWCFVGLMMLMSVVGKTEEAVSGAAWGGNMLMAMFGGGMIPLAFMPGFMATLGQLSPVKWSILSLEGAIWRGFTPTEMLFPCGLLLAIGAAGMALGAWRFARTSG